MKNILYDDFNFSINQVSDIAEREIGKRFPKLDRMLKNNDGVNIAIKLMKSAMEQSGFHDLYAANRLELSVEFLVINLKYDSIFENDIIEDAQRRLDKYNYLDHMKND